MRAAVCLVVFGAVLAVSYAVAAPADVLRDCAARVSSSARGLEELERRCPELSAALSDLRYTQSLGADWQSRLTTTGLATLADLTEHYQSTQKQTSPDRRGVRAIVDGLARRQVQNRSRWELFLEWLRSLLGNDPDRSLSWLDRWLDKLRSAGSAMTYVMDAVCVGILIVGVVFVVKELRTTGVLSRRRAGAAVQRPAAATGIDWAPEDPKLDAATLRDQPGLLLRLLVNCLSRKGRVQADRHLTHRELVARVKLDETERQKFADVAGLAEAMLYGQRAEVMDAVAIHDLERVVDEGRQLLSRLEHSSGGI